MGMIEGELMIIVLENTKGGSRHQTEALSLLKSHLFQFAADIKMITCNQCGGTLKAVRWTERKGGQIADTWGYVEFDDETVCHRCLHEGYIGDIYLPKGAA